MTPATENRLSRLYAAIVGYDPLRDGCTAAEVLDTLRWMRTARTMCPDDPSAYDGPTMTRAEMTAAATRGNEITTASDAYDAETMARRALESGNLSSARYHYLRAADLWSEIVWRLARNGETLVSDTFKAEQRRARRKADAVIFYA
jgi:hypothetical protein